jgi:hypothetical protein
MFIHLLPHLSLRKRFRCNDYIPLLNLRRFSTHFNAMTRSVTGSFFIYVVLFLTTRLGYQAIWPMTACH